MRALVTGAAGFIGSHLCARLVADGHAVVGLDDLSEGSRENLDRGAAVDLLVHDLSDEQAVLLAAAGCDVIFHEDAKRSVATSRTSTTSSRRTCSRLGRRSARSARSSTSAAARSPRP